jgi:hypothetical protein
MKRRGPQHLSAPAPESGRLKGSETLSANVVLTLDKVGLTHTIDGKIELQ